MSDRIEQYLAALKEALTGTDPATTQDALSDAEEHLRSALAEARGEKPGAADGKPGATEEDLLGPILEQYGTPAEVAAGYRDFEQRFGLPFQAPHRKKERGPFHRFVAVLGDPQAYAALLFVLFSLVTGILYFTWAVTGVSLSLGLMVLIFGLPFFGLFVFSLQGMALVEGRLIEAMLGIRMPRRAPIGPGGTGIWGKFLARVRDPRTWTTLLYFIVLKLPLGVLSFSVFITLLAYALGLIALPVVQLVLDRPVLWFGSAYYVPWWFMPIVVLAGFLDLVVVLHLAKLVGRIHGALGKGMLVPR